MDELDLRVKATVEGPEESILALLGLLREVVGVYDILHQSRSRDVPPIYKVEIAFPTIYAKWEKRGLLRSATFLEEQKKRLDKALQLQRKRK